MKEKLTNQKKKQSILLKGFVVLTLFCFALRANAQCNAAFTYIDNNGMVSFTNTSTGGSIINYSWSIQDGPLSLWTSSTNPSHQFLTSGVYAVCLTISDSSTNCSDTFCDSIIISTVNTPCQIHAAFTYVVSENNVMFTNTSTGNNINYYSLNYGDGYTSSSWYPTYQYATNSSYIVCLTVTDTISNCSDTFCDTIITGINNPCHAGFTYSNNNGVVTFTNTSYTAGGSTKYFNWYFGDNLFSQSTASNPTYTYSSSGIYNVCLSFYAYDSINNYFLCSDSICMQINVNIVASDSCHAAYTYSINNGLITFTNNSTSNTAHYSWIFGDGTYSFDKNPSHQYSTPGLHFACLTITDCATNCFDTFCDSIYVDTLANTPCNVHAAFTYTVSGNQVAFTNNSTGNNINSYSMNFGDGYSSSSWYPTYQYAANSSYIVCLTVTDTISNCSDTFCDTIITGINNPCHAGFTYSNNNGVVTFTNTSYTAGGSTKYFNWYFGDNLFSQSTASNPTYTYSSSGIYNVCLSFYAYDSINNYFLCSDSICMQINVNIGNPDPCNAAYTITEDSLNIGHYTIHNTSTGNGLSYFWNFGDGTTSNLELPSHTYTSAGPFYICLTVTDSSGSCTHTYCDSIGTNGYGGIISFTVESTVASVNEHEVVESLLNYPNPFNENTTIKYELKQNAAVHLSIMNMVGKTIVILANENKSSGVHSTIWNAEGVASGIYFVNLKANTQVITKKLVIK